MATTKRLSPQRDRQVSFWLSNQDYEQLCRLARSQERSMSGTLRTMIREMASEALGGDDGRRETTQNQPGL